MNRQLFRFLPFVVTLLFLSSNSYLLAAEADQGDSYNAPVADKWALLVGVSKFKDPRLNLRWAAKDAEDFYNYLTTKGQFAPDHVKLLTNEQATEKEIVSELGGKWLPHVAAPDDLVLIFISSHGSPAYMDTAGVNYILAHDSDPDDLYTTAIEMQDLVEVISKRIHAARVVLIVDACHSGALEVGGKGLGRANFDVNQIALGKGRVVLSSSLPEEVSWELKDQNNSIFTRLLIDTLSAKDNLNLFDAYKTLKDSVQRTALKERGMLQTPVLKSTWLGNPPVLGVIPTKSLLLASTKPVTTVIASSSVPTPTAPVTIPPVVSTALVSVPKTTVRIASIPVVSPPIVSPKTPYNPAPIPTAAIPTGLPPVIAIVPFNGPLATNIEALPPTSKVLWGKISLPSELMGLAPKLSENLFYDLRSKFHDRALGPRLTKMSLAPVVKGTVDRVDTSKLTPAGWMSIGKLLQARYIIAGSIDEADWSTSFMANKYTAFVTAKVISGDTGEVLASVNRLKVHKAPTHGDLSGGQKYFEGTVMQEAAHAILKEFTSTLKDDN